MNKSALAIFLFWPWLFATSAETATQQKLFAPAIQVAMIETGDVQIPAEFRYAIYENLVERVRESKAFPMLYRAGDRTANGIDGLVTLHTKLAGFQEGSQTKRELTTVLGATKLDVTAWVTDRGGHTLLDQKITGRVRFFGENLGVASDLAKRIAKALGEKFW